MLEGASDSLSLCMYTECLGLGTCFFRFRFKSGEELESYNFYIPFTSEELSPSSSSELTICAHFLRFFARAPNRLGEVVPQLQGLSERGEGRRGFLARGLPLLGIPKEDCLP